MPNSQRGKQPTNQRGAITAELAIGIPLLLIVTAAMVWLLSLGLVRVQVIDAARETARLIARGEPESLAINAGLGVAPVGTVIEVSRIEGNRVQVEARVVPRGPFGLPLPGDTTLASVMITSMEWGSQDAGP